MPNLPIRTRQLTQALLLASVLLATPALADIATLPMPRPQAEAEPFERFRQTFAKAVVRRDIDAVVRMCVFPLRSYEMSSVIHTAERRTDPVGPEVTEAEFRKHFKKLFTPAIVHRLKTSRALRHEVDDGEPGEAWYSVGHSGGKTWSAWFVFGGGSVAGGKWQLVATDNVSQ
jgi:hypothetical protein